MCVAWRLSSDKQEGAVLKKKRASEKDEWVLTRGEFCMGWVENHQGYLEAISVLCRNSN